MKNDLNTKKTPQCANKRKQRVSHPHNPMTTYMASHFAFSFLALTYISTCLMLLISHFPPETATATFLSTVEMLLGITMCTMVVPMAEMLIRSGMAIMVYKMDQRMDMKRLAALLVAYESKKETTTSEITPEKAQVEVCTLMKTLLNLEIEECEAMKKIRESASSVTPSIQTVSATPSVTYEEIKTHDEGSSSRSAAQTVV